MDEDLSAYKVLYDIFGERFVKDYGIDDERYKEIDDYIRHTFFPSVNEVILNAINLLNTTIIMGSCVIKQLDSLPATIVNDTFMDVYLPKFIDYRYTINEYYRILMDYINELSLQHCKYGNRYCYITRRKCNCRSAIRMIQLDAGYDFFYIYNTCGTTFIKLLESNYWIIPFNQILSIN